MHKPTKAAVRNIQTGRPDTKGAGQKATEKGIAKPNPALVKQHGKRTK